MMGWHHNLTIKLEKYPCGFVPQRSQLSQMSFLLTGFSISLPGQSFMYSIQHFNIHYRENSQIHYLLI